MSAIGARSDKAVGYGAGRIDIGIAGAAAPALALGAAVPVAFHRREVKGRIHCRARHAAVDRIERKTDVDGDVLRRRIVRARAAVAQHHQAIGDGDLCRTRGRAGEGAGQRPRRCIGRHDLRVRVFDVAAQQFGPQHRACRWLMSGRKVRQRDRAAADRDRGYQRPTYNSSQAPHQFLPSLNRLYAFGTNLSKTNGRLVRREARSARRLSNVL